MEEWKEGQASYSDNTSSGVISVGPNFLLFILEVGSGQRNRNLILLEELSPD
jgi:hypothetical protein